MVYDLRLRVQFIVPRVWVLRVLGFAPGLWFRL